ncbi:MAG TPA: TetR family transcriptional regulator [Capillimicrobium sp.]|nr:TetR family transcriptional regulator [Capillimicrobium sp.]
MEAASPARQARGQERVEQILRATLAVIGRGGVGAVTHRTVAEEAGVPLGSLTYYFGSKQELLREALRLHVVEDAGRLRALAAELADSGADGQQIVDGFADVLESGHPDIAQFELYLEAARDPALREVAAESLRAYAEVAEAALRAAGVPNASGAASVVVAAIDGLGLHRSAAGDKAVDLRAALALLLRALSPPSGA